MTLIHTVLRRIWYQSLMKLPKNGWPKRREWWFPRHEAERMRSESPNPCQAAGNPRGFALVATLLMLLLLAVITVGMLSLSSVSMRASSREQAMAEARANARLALMMAMNDLQRLAGPDQRITATADIAGTADGASLAAGEFPGNNTTVNHAQKSLSAVQDGTRHWTGVWKNNDAPDDIFTQTPSPVHLAWLVSGNENDGNAITPGSPGRTVPLVGGVSAEQTVRAPLVDLAPRGGSRHSAGRYAWWIGDEGVKAKLNLVSATKPGAALTYDTLAAPRRGWEVVRGCESYPGPGTADEEELEKVISMNQASLLPGQVSPETLRRLFHAATAESFGVLSDPLRGGLKVDLTAVLDQSLPAQADPSIPHAPAENSNLIPQAIIPGLKGPKWTALKKFHDMAASAQAGFIQVRPATVDSDAALSPVITDLRLLFGARLSPQADGFRVQPCVKIAIALSNPYALPLRWDQPLELEFLNATDPARLTSRIYGAAGMPAIIPQRASEPAALNRAVFVIPPATLPAGESRAYTQPASVLRSLISATSRIEIPLAPFATSNPANFSNAVILNHPSKNTIGGTLDLEVREDQITCQLNVELRLAGSAGILRRLERLEFDNPYFDITRRSFDQALAKRFTEPFPIQIYAFQLSQPGGDYAAMLPAPDQLGLRGSTLRTFADFNVRATRFRKPLICYNPPPYFMQIADSKTALPFTPPGGDTGTDFTRGLDGPQPGWGRSSPTTRQTVLFSYPERLSSMAQFQHADLTADDGGVSVGHQPGNAFGNSHASPFVKRELSIQNRQDFNITGFDSFNETRTNYHDMSYLLNAALWDGCFLSTVEDDDSAIPRNPRMIASNPATGQETLRDGKRAASRLLVDGAFNVNSVEKDAWVAMLAGSRSLRHAADNESTSGTLFPRSLEQPSSSSDPPTGSAGDSFAGFRRMNDAQIDQVAGEITRQVRLRGPFVSLSHFVNRALVGLTENPELGRSGALQSALDRSGANISPDGVRNVFQNIDPAEDRLNLQCESDGSPRADLTGSDATRWQDADGTWPGFSRDENPGAIAGIPADREMLTDPDLRIEQGYRSTGIPGWITQADVLQVIGPSLAARSDTFRIRAYGESIDPANGMTLAKIWCEAIIQRLPEYMDSTDAAEERGGELSSINHRLGRRFRMTSFRWLAADEI